jgi:hypothetical protein
MMNMLLYGVVAPSAQGVTTGGFHVQTVTQNGATRDEGGSRPLYIDRGQLINTSVSFSTLVAGRLTDMEVRFTSQNDNNSKI